MTDAIDTMPPTMPLFGDGTPDPNAPVEVEEAPYGLNLDGTPRAKPGRKPRNSPGRPSSTRATMTGPARKSATKKAPAAKPPGGAKTPAAKAPATMTTGGPAAIDYAAGLGNLAAVPQAILIGAGQKTKNPAFLADAAAIGDAIPALAVGVEQLCNDFPDSAFTAWAERILSASPYAAVIGGLLGLGAQIAANHGIIQPGTMGSKPLEDMVPPAALAYLAQSAAQAPAE